jgi:hypothetical protein
MKYKSNLMKDRKKIVDIKIWLYQDAEKSDGTAE